jgi:hypothetical protein
VQARERLQPRDQQDHLPLTRRWDWHTVGTKNPTLPLGEMRPVGRLPEHSTSGTEDIRPVPNNCAGTAYNCALRRSASAGSERLTSSNVEPHIDFLTEVKNRLPGSLYSPAVMSALMQKISNPPDGSFRLTSSRPSSSGSRSQWRSTTRLEPSVRTKWTRADTPALERMKPQTAI